MEKFAFDQLKEVALAAHADQFDKAGVPYGEHLKAVAANVEAMGYGQLHQLVAFFHDCLEDAGWDAAQLFAAGLPAKAVAAVVAMTKQAGEDYDAYLARVKADPIARVVKLADLAHNMDIGRIPDPGPKDFARLDKYAKAKAFLLAHP